MGQPIAIVHSFQDQLAYSESASEEPFWDAIYRKAFPNLVAHISCKGNTQSQRLGIDRIVHLPNGRTLMIDEKKRKPKSDGSEYTDILLEYLSNDQTLARGWIEKDLQIDYLAYAFMKSKRVYLFPWELLRMAWRQYGADWLGTFHKIEAQNPGYKTLSVAVPIKTLQLAIVNVSIIQL